MRAVIGQFSGPYSPARTAKIKSFFVAKRLHDLSTNFLNYEANNSLKLSFTLNCILKHPNGLKTIFNLLVLLLTWFRNLKPFLMNGNHS